MIASLSLITCNVIGYFIHALKSDLLLSIFYRKGAI